MKTRKEKLRNKYNNRNKSSSILRYKYFELNKKDLWEIFRSFHKSCGYKRKHYKNVEHSQHDEKVATDGRKRRKEKKII
jgi:hypothetical protein